MIIMLKTYFWLSVASDLYVLANQHAYNISNIMLQAYWLAKYRSLVTNNQKYVLGIRLPSRHLLAVT